MNHRGTEATEVDARQPVTPDELSRAIIGSAIEVHRAIGPGLLESAYEECLAIEFQHRRLPFVRQAAIPLSYRGHDLDHAFRADFIVGDRIIVELKAVDAFAPIHEAQLLTYLRLTGHRVGLMINFNVPVLRDGILRRVL